MALLTNLQIKREVDRYLAEVLDSKAQLARVYGASYQSHIVYLKEFVLRGGKRLRPYLVYLGYAAAADSAQLPPIQVLAAVELFHASLLIHDDVMDQDIVRYGGPSVLGHYAGLFSFHTAESAAILAGDLALALAFEQLALAPLEADMRLQLVNELLLQYQEVLAGQFQDTVPLGKPKMSLSEIISIHVHKTAAYSTVGPLKIGLLLAGVGGVPVTMLTNYGNTLGVVFGLTDELLGMFADPAVTGKPACSDLHEAKPTALFYYAAKLLRGDAATLLRSLLGRPHQDAENLMALREALITSGARERVEHLAAGYADEAKSAIAGGRGPAYKALAELPGQILQRDR